MRRYLNKVNHESLSKLWCWRDLRPVRQFLHLGVALLALQAPLIAAAGVITGLEIPGLTAPYTDGVSQYSFVDSGACSVPVKVTLADPTLNLYVQSTKVASGTTRNAWVCDNHQTISVVVYRGWSEQARLTIAKVQQAPPPPAPTTEPTVIPADTTTTGSSTSTEQSTSTVSGALASLSIANLSPAFSPNITAYAIPDTGNCSIPVTATLANPQHKLYVQSTATTSGQTVNAWMCDGHPQLSIVVYQNWTEMGRYTVYKGSIPVTVGDPEPDPVDEPPADDPDGDSGTSPDPDPVPDTGDDYAPSPTALAEPARFLNYASFGPTPAAMAEVASLGIQGWLDQQFALPPSQIPSGLNVNQLRSQVFLNMANGQDQLRQRMVFALGQVLVVSSNKNVNGYEMEPWVRLLSDNAFGNYRTLLRKLSVSPSMGKFLDHANSQKASLITAPNENYPRELMQLFSIGLWQLNQDGSRKLNGQGQPIATYSQTELREVARALTGWTYPTAPGATPRTLNGEYFVGDMEPRPISHDTGAKTLPGGVVLPAKQSPDKDLDDVVDFLFNHPNIAPFMATRLIRGLVTSNPSPAYISRVADIFDNNGSGVRGDLKAVLRAVLTDAEALKPPNNTRARLKDPLLFFIGMGRALSASIADPSQFHYLFANQSELVLTAPSVFGFYSPLAPLPDHPELFGPEFQIYPPSLAIQRANMLYQILTGQFGSAFQVNTAPYVAVAGDTEALLDKINNDLLQGAMSVELRGILTAACAAAYDNNQRAIGALYLALLSGEYQVQR